MKKLLVLILSLILICSTMLLLSSCSILEALGIKKSSDQKPHEHPLTKVEATEPTCLDEGNVEYWICVQCKKYFSNSSGTREIALNSTVIPTSSHVFYNSRCEYCREFQISAALDFELDTKNNGYVITKVTGSLSEYITLPSSHRDTPVIAIAENAFADCTGIKSITVPDSITEIGSGAFKNCSALTELIIGNGLKSIGTLVLEGCVSLTKIEISSNPNYKANGGGIYSKSGSVFFMYSPGIKSSTVVLPSGVTKIADKAFYGVTRLSSITIPNSVTEIGEYAFCGCTSLSSVILPKSISEIKNSTFKDCTSLTSISIPDYVKTIAAEAFSGCQRLSSVDMSIAIKSIGAYAFANCIKLTNVRYSNTQSAWEKVSIAAGNERLKNATFDFKN